MITPMSHNTNTFAIRGPQAAAGSSSEVASENAPTESVDISSAKPKSRAGRSLARTGAFVALAAALCLGGLAAPAQAHDAWRPHHHHSQVYSQPYAQPQVQTGNSIGFQIDGRGRVGVWVGNETYNPYTGVYQRSGVGIGPGGVSVHVEAGRPGYPAYPTYPTYPTYPVQTMPLPQGYPVPVPVPMPCPVPSAPVIVVPAWPGY